MNYLIAGLGNPGDKYAGTRHNVGFAAVDELASAWSADAFTKSSHAKAFVAEVMQDGEKVVLVKPQTYMNNSGEAVQSLARYFDVPAEHVLVAYDDIDLPLGEMKLAVNRGSGGHRGLQSVINELGTKEFARLRIGISPTNDDGSIDKQKVPGKGINPFVMGQFSSEELAVLQKQYPEILDATKAWLQNGAESAMNLLN